MKADIYVGYSQSDWDVSTYINDEFDESLYSFHNTKKDAMKEVTQIKKHLFKNEQVNVVTVTIDLNGGIEQDTFTYTNKQKRSK